MSFDLSTISSQKVKGIPSGETVELQSFWKDQNVIIIFFRRWGCMFCRLWAKELGEIYPILKKNNIRLVGIGIEEAGSKEFVDGKYFNGDLYYAEDKSIYQTLGFKRFNLVSILTSLFWKQSREAIVKSKSLGLGGDLKGDWVQTGGALLVGGGGSLVKHFLQSGPSDHLPNSDILKLFDLENEYKAETMANKKREEFDCNELLVVASLLMVEVAGEVAAPYPASGWRPEGPAFELPLGEAPQKQQYLPSLDPTRPQIPNNYDDNVDVSVQGLPTVEQQPIFQLSPINGQQISGPSINTDVAKLNPSLQQQQYQQQLEKSIQFARQREFDAGRRPSNGLPNQQSPKLFASPSTTTTFKPELKSSQPETTTESLNQGETLEDDRDYKNNKEKVSVEITKQNLQEYPPELFLSPLAQLNLQQQFVPLSQLAQIRAPLYYQQQTAAQSQGFGGPAPLSALPPLIAQRELLSQQFLTPNQGFAQSPIVVQEQSLVQEPLTSYTPNPVSQYQPLKQYQPQQVQNFPQFKLPTQQVILQPQGNQIQATQFQPQQPNQFQLQQPGQFQYQLPNQLQSEQPDQFQYQQPNQLFLQQPDQFTQKQPKDVEEVEQNDQQVVLQNYQPQFYQPGFNYPNQDLIQQYQPQFVQQLDPSQYQAQEQGQGLQSGLDLNQQGNGIEQNEEGELDEREKVEEDSKTTAVATAFGTRTQPRTIAAYGAPIPKIQATQGYPTTTEYIGREEPTTDDAPAVAQATAVAGGRRSSKIRSRRVRPIFTLDRSGHLVLAQQ